jgi:ABC-2 type transport system permease protein
MMQMTWSTLARARGQILGWALGIFLWALLVMSLWDTVQSQQAQFEQLLASYPPEFTAVFGEMSSFATPSGYLSVEFFSLMPLLLGIFAVLGGSWMIAGDEERGVLDLYLAHPIRRPSFFAGRAVGQLSVLAAVLAIGWAGLAIPIVRSSIPISLGDLALPFLSLFALLCVYFGLGVFLSQVLPSGRLAAMVSGLALFGGYILTILGRLSPDYQSISRYTPFAYYQGGDALRAMNWSWWTGLMAAGVVLILAAAWAFHRRDIRVSGEGSWGWTRRILKRRPA